MQTNIDLSAVPTWLLVVAAIWIAAELALYAVGLVALFRTPAERLTLPRWAWVLVILLVQVIGAIVFLVAGRRPPQVDQRSTGTATPAADRLSVEERSDEHTRLSGVDERSTKQAVDVLYGSRKDLIDE